MLHQSKSTFSVFFAIFSTLSGCSSPSSSSTDLGTGGSPTQPKVSVVITSPLPNHTVKGNVRIQISISDSIPGSYCEDAWLYVDGNNEQLIPTDFYPYSCVWDASTGVINGKYILQVVADFNIGNSVWSAPDTIIVNN